MAISKIVYKSSAQAAGETWMDATPATAAAEDITAPKTAMLADGNLTEGTGTGGGEFDNITQDEDGYIVIGAEGGSGLTNDVKSALLACFRNMAWINSSGQTYYNALYAALYGQQQPYIFYDWLKGDGNAFIDTGLDARIYGADSYERTTTFAMTTFAASDYPHIMGARNLYGTSGFFICGEISASNNTIYVCLCDHEENFTASSRDEIVTVKTADKKVYYNDTLIYTGTQDTVSIAYDMNILLFSSATHDPNAMQYGDYNMMHPCPAKIYEFTVNDSQGNPVAHMVPAKRAADDVLGMYDTVRDVFYTNANATGSFTIGND